jgi:uncharacterized phage protein (TIGR02220 family)
MTRKEIEAKFWASLDGQKVEGNEDIYAAFDFGWKCCEYFNKNKSKEEAKDNIPYAHIIDLMNSILQRSFRASEANRRFIRARWNEGYRKPDFAKVCKVKHAQWDKDPAMCAFLRPETLFGTKMEAYLQEKEPQTDVPDYM